MDRFFKIIRRVNSVLFLIVLLGVGALSAWYAWRLYDWYQNSDSYGADNSGTDDEGRTRSYSSGSGGTSWGSGHK